MRLHVSTGKKLFHVKFTTPHNRVLWAQNDLEMDTRGQENWSRDDLVRNVFFMALWDSPGRYQDEKYGRSIFVYI